MGRLILLAWRIFFANDPYGDGVGTGDGVGNEPSEKSQKFFTAFRCNSSEKRGYKKKEEK